MLREPNQIAKSPQIRSRMPIAALACVASFVLQISSAAGQSPAIRFTATVPSLPKQMRLYKLAPTSAPLEFLNEKLNLAKLPALKLEERTFIVRGGLGQTETDRVRAFADKTTGDTHFIPNLAELIRNGKATPLTDAQTIGRRALTDVRFIPKDVTEVRLSDAIPVMGGATDHANAKTSSRAIMRTVPKVVMTIVPAVRYAGGYRVYGRGSHALVSLANDGSTVGALRRWRTASLGDQITPVIKTEDVQAEIERQLRPHVSEKGSQATVDTITLAYYDGNANYLQPVYRFEARIISDGKKTSGIRIAGFVPIGKVLEPIPDLAGKPSGEMPQKAERVAQGAKKVATTSLCGPTGLAGITLGEYANQDWPNNGAYVDMGNSFLSGLNFMDSLFPGFKPPITRTQWYDAYPWEVVGPSSKYFMNSVNVAYTEPHGNWLYNTTLSNNAQGWYVPNIGTGGNPGYGAATGGVLATWIIMSCEVVPSMYDRQNEAGASDNPYTAFDAWWPVFQGLHNVIGFRTEMLYPDDDLQFGFGYDASLGGDLNAAWFQEVAANDPNDGPYNDGHLIGNPLVHYDRASTMIDARNLGQSIYSVGPQTASTTLWNFWMGN